MSTSRHPSSILLPLVILFYLVVVLRTSWLNDDAYITFRTVDNFVNGYGLTWNPDERVQAYTHPLWMFLLSAVYAITGEIFYTAQWLSITVSAITVWLLVFRVAKQWETAVLALLTLTFSKAYIDYSTSGLENPLTHLLLVLFLWRYFTAPNHASPASYQQQLRQLSFIAAAGILNRMDTLFIFLPMLLYAVWQTSFTHQTPNRLVVLYCTGQSLLLGFLPLIAWEMFSVIYYGFPFPNTAYAKAFATGVSNTTLIQQGMLYFLNSLKWDPITLTIILLGIVVASFRFRVIGFKFQVLSWRSLLPVLGIVFYLLYILKIGGDFMSGRFLATPFLVSVVLLMEGLPDLSRWWVGTAVFLILLLGFSARFPTPLSGPNFGTQPEAESQVRDGDIADERMYYYPYTGLLNPNRQLHPWAQQGMEIHTNGPKVLEHGNIGFLGFYAGPAIHIVDRNGLADPLLARLPARDNQNWRIGHFRRNVPAGYTDGFWTKTNHLTDANLAIFYDKLSGVIRDDLFTLQRWQEIWKLNTGQYDHLLPSVTSSP